MAAAIGQNCGTSRLNQMKIKTLTCISALALASSAHAWVGGPLSNNSFTQDGKMDGTYQAVLRGKNMVAVMILGTANTQSWTDTGLSSVTTTGTGTITTSYFQLTGNEGRFAMFVNGTVVIGSAAASVDTNGRSITAVLEGSRNRGTQVIQKEVVTTDTAGNFSTATRTYTLNDVLHVSGEFDAKFTTTYPNQTFQGNGQFEITDPVGVEESLVSLPTSESYESGSSLTTTETSRITRIVPVLDLSKLDFSVYGVKTSNTPPSFRSSVTIEYPSVSGG